MHTLKTTTIVSAVLISLLLSACGGSGSPLPAHNTSSKTSSSLSSGAIDTTSPEKIGTGSGAAFIEGAIGVGIGGNTLAAGGSTSLIVDVVSSTNTLVTTPIQVTFNSRCYAAEEATLTIGSEATNKITTDIGHASITYTSKGCVGDDEITATAIIDGEAKVARVTINVAQDTIQSISFVDATPDKIFLKDSGGAQTSTVRFLVKGSMGAPIKNIPLNFSLSTQLGGIALTETAVTTDNTGHASTVVQAGTIPTAVEVIAIESQSGVTARSNKLSIGTGMPDQNSTSVSATHFNPAGWEYDGEEVGVTIRLADAFNNPPPDGTSVQFVTEGGAIDTNCTTENGACTVQWKSQAPRPSNGRVTILATTVGNESFEDNDGDGLYSLGTDIFNTHNNGGNCNPNIPLSTAAATPGGNDAPCDDLGEAYLDKDEDSEYQTGEYYADFNINKKYDTENGIYNGVLCASEGTGCTKSPVNIRQEMILVMSSERPMTEDGRLLGQPETIEMGANETQSFNVILADINGNSMPMGTKISLNTSTASDVTINHSMSGSVGSTHSPTSFGVTLKASETKRPAGVFSIIVTSPKGTAYSFTTRIVQRPEENTAARYIGKGIGQNFLAGHIDVAIGGAVLPPTGSTNLSVNFVDEDNDLTAGNAQVTFTSPCVTAGTATLSDSNGNPTNVVSTQTSRATILYTATGCSGTDEVTATADLPSLLINTATAVLEIAETSAAQNIIFDSASPPQISLKGSGSVDRPEVSTVSFIVSGANGELLANVPVQLSLDNSIGGVCIIDGVNCTQKITINSDADGYAKARVQAGTIATTVRVTASAIIGGGASISTQSSRLVISTGIPDQDSMSLGASEHNPPVYINGYEVDVTIRMADAFNNAVPEGTAVSFTTSGGSVDASCITNESGACTVKWRNQNPKPASGRVTILATALGNESFIDTNGNGTYDAVDTFAIGSSCSYNTPLSSSTDHPDACDDLGEAYLDRNQNNAYDLGEVFVDVFGTDNSLIPDGERTDGNGIYDGVLCSGTDCTKNTVTVREDLVLVLSTGVTQTNADGLLTGQPGNIVISTSGPSNTGLISITLQDTNGNSMPTGTSVSLDDSDVSNATVFINPDPVEVPSNRTGPTTFTVSVKGDTVLPATGSFKIVVEVPEKSGVIGSTRSYTTTIN